MVITSTPVNQLPRARPVRHLGRWGSFLLVCSLGGYWFSVWSQPQTFSMIDTRVYLAGARVLVHSQNLYGMRTTGAHLQFTYPPLAAMVFAWMPVVGLWWAKVFSILFCQIALIGCCWFVLSWLEIPQRLRWATTALCSAALLWIEPVQATLHFGQINLLVALLVLADLSRRMRWLPPGMLIGLAAGIKLVPGLFIVYLLLAGRGRAAATATAVFAGTVLAGFVATPGQAGAYWTRFALDSGRVGQVAHVSNQSLLGVVSRLAGGPGLGRAIWLPIAITVGAVGLAIAATLHRRGMRLYGALACACTGLLVSPVSWNHHWVWAAPIAIALGHRAWQRRSAGLAAALVAWLTVFASGIIWQVPRSFGREYRWTGWQLVAGNAYVLAGIACMCWFAWLSVAIATGPRQIETRNQQPTTLT
jgi:alpha-1,2-mannosyltransferase